MAGSLIGVGTEEATYPASPAARPNLENVAPARRYPIGAEIQSDGRTHVRVWAPRCQRVELLWKAASSATSPATADVQSCELVAGDDGYFAGFAAAGAGALYGYRLDGSERVYYDPASRFQPEGPEGWSQVVDPATFCWTDHDWRGLTPAGQVLYEMHLGTFTREGTWQAAAEQLDELARIGITAVQIMPVAEFPGEFGWGYDGVHWFAPCHHYGTPDDFRRFVDRAHALGVGVILDVVYNHFGSVSNYLNQFSDHYKSRRYANEWGEALNFDGEHAGPVREFVLANVRYWIEEFHLDGFRLDATQAIKDASPTHLLDDLERVARQAAAPRGVLIVAENEPQNTRLLHSKVSDGFGLDACLNDDFHHAARVRLTGHNEAYYSDFLGTPTELLAALKYGYLYQGQFSPWQRQPRGTPTGNLPAVAFVNFLQNHDQVANSGRGERIHQLTSPGRHRAMTALWLLAPQTPMIFQGQEFSSSKPFLYFADFTGDQARAVAQGRADFLAQFPSLNTPEARAALARPEDRQTFLRSKLDFSERESNAAAYALHIDLLRLRREDVVFRAQRADRLDGVPLSNDALVVRYFGEDGNDRLLLVNFGRELRLSPLPCPLFAPPAETEWQTLWSSEALEYGGSGTPNLERYDDWRLPGEAAIVLRPEEIAPVKSGSDE